MEMPGQRRGQTRPIEQPIGGPDRPEEADGWKSSGQGMPRHHVTGDGIVDGEADQC